MNRNRFLRNHRVKPITKPRAHKSTGGNGSDPLKKKPTASKKKKEK